MAMSLFNTLKLRKGVYYPRLAIFAVVEAVLLESQYAGSIPWWAAIARADQVHIDLGGHYVKGSYRNRCEILSPNGVLRLSVPLEKGKHQRRPMNAVRISYADRWQKIHWMSLEASYRRSAYFEFYEQDILPLFSYEHTFLHELNRTTYETICALIGLKKEVIYENDYLSQAEFDGTDMRDRYSPKADIPFELTSYPQVFADRHLFVPGLSIWDAVFNLGPKTKDYLVNISLEMP
jgi:hypothetical protein